LDHRTGPREELEGDPEDDESGDPQGDQGDLIENEPPPPDTPVITINRILMRVSRLRQVTFRSRDDDFALQFVVRRHFAFQLGI